jgi:hypothetical protein
MTLKRDKLGRLILDAQSEANADWLKLVNDGKEKQGDLKANDDALARWRERHARADSNQEPRAS